MNFEEMIFGMMLKNTMSSLKAIEEAALAFAHAQHAAALRDRANSGIVDRRVACAVREDKTFKNGQYCYNSDVGWFAMDALPYPRIDDHEIMQIVSLVTCRDFAKEPVRYWSVLEELEAMMYQSVDIDDVEPKKPDEDDEDDD